MALAESWYLGARRFVCRLKLSQCVTHKGQVMRTAPRVAHNGWIVSASFSRVAAL